MTSVEMLYLLLQQETDGSHPAWPTTPAVHMHGPAERFTDKRYSHKNWGSKKNTHTHTLKIKKSVCCTFGDGSFSITVIRESGGRPPAAESGMKEDQYPYRTLFSVLFTTATRHCSAA